MIDMTGVAVVTLPSITSVIVNPTVNYVFIPMRIETFTNVHMGISKDTGCLRGLSRKDFPISIKAKTHIT